MEEWPAQAGALCLRKEAKCSMTCTRRITMVGNKGTTAEATTITIMVSKAADTDSKAVVEVSRQVLAAPFVALADYPCFLLEQAG